MRHLPQEVFQKEGFSSGRCNLHAHTPEGAIRRPVVVLVHGLGGGGYSTWGGVPSRLFNGVDGLRVDVAVYDYRSAHRGLLRWGSKVDFWINQLAGHVRQLAKDYSEIILVGHSLGGLVIELVAKKILQSRDAQSLKAQTALAALVVVASPRAGSGWAMVPLRILPEVAMLRRLGSKNAGLDEYFSTQVETQNTAFAPPGKNLLPLYAVIGGGDKIVSQFSAAMGVPAHQKLHLDAGHISIVKPTDEDDELVRWLLRDVIEERLEVRAQSSREADHASQRMSPPRPVPRSDFVTSFMTDTTGLQWAEVYNDARRAASTSTFTIHDAGDIGGTAIDLLIAIHDANLIVQANPTVRSTLQAACSLKATQGSMSLGICPVGGDFRAAETAVDEWLLELPAGKHGEPLAPTYVAGAPGVLGLREVLARLLFTVIGRDPRRVVRTALAGSDSGASLNMYDDPRGVGF